MTTPAVYRKLTGVTNAEAYSDESPPDTLEMLATSVAPVTPAAGRVTLTARGGQLYLKDSSGREANANAPSLIQSSQIQVIKNPGLATVTPEGTPAPTLSGTATTADDATGRWVNLATAATLNSSAGLLSGFNVTMTAWKPETVFAVKTDPTAITTARYWVGLFSATPVASATPAAHLAAFRYDTVSDTTAFWRCVTATGTATQTVTVTTVPIAVNTAYDLRIKAASATSVEFYINDVLVATHTTNLPTTTTLLGTAAQVTTLVAGARNIKFGRLAVVDYV